MNNTELMERAIDGLVAADASALFALMHDDIEWVVRGSTSYAGVHRGKKAVRALLRQMAAQVEGSYRLAHGRVVASGEYVVVETRGDNLLRNGQRYDNEYCWLCRFEGGKLRELIEYGDSALAARVLAPFSPEGALLGP